jgi:hypothetical protein
MPRPGKAAITAKRKQTNTPSLEAAHVWLSLAAEIETRMLPQGRLRRQSLNGTFKFDPQLLLEDSLYARVPDCYVHAQQQSGLQACRYPVNGTQFDADWLNDITAVLSPRIPACERTVQLEQTPWLKPPLLPKL